MKMVDVNNIPDAPLKIILVIHFFLSTWGMQGDWSSDAYLFYNFLFFISLFWAIYQREAPQPIEIALFIGVSSILLDIIILTCRFPSVIAGAGERFSAGMAILNLLIRPVTSMVLYRIHADRTGTSGAFSNNIGGLFGTNSAQRAPYEDIDHGVHQIVPGIHPTSRPGDRSGSPPTYAAGGLDRDNKMPPPYHC